MREIEDGGREKTKEERTGEGQSARLLLDRSEGARAISRCAGGRREPGQDDMERRRGEWRVTDRTSYVYSALIFSDATMSCCRVGLLMEMGAGGAAGQAGRPVEGAWEPSSKHKVHMQVANENSKVGHSSQHSTIQPRLILSPPQPSPYPTLKPCPESERVRSRNPEPQLLSWCLCRWRAWRPSPEC